MAKTPKFDSVDAYLAAQPDGPREQLTAIRDHVAQAVPTSELVLSYGVPSFRDAQVFFHFAAFKTHIGIYPPLAADHPLTTQLAPWRAANGNLKFPLGEPVPLDLIEKLAVALWRQDGQ